MKNLSLSAGLAPALFLLCSLSASASTEADHDTQRQHGAHDHGHATLNLVQEGKTIQLMLESPAVNIIGFEHAAKTPQEKQKIENAIELLKQGEKLFGFPASAQCAQIEVEVESEHTELTEHHDESKEEHESNHDEPESHSEFEVSYQFVCDAPTKLDTLKVHFFEFFPLTEEIEAQLVTEKRQFAAELSPQSSTINF